MRPLYVWVALALASVLPFLYTYTLVNRARFASRFAARFALATSVCFVESSKPESVDGRSYLNQFTIRICNLL